MVRTRLVGEGGWSAKSSTEALRLRFLGCESTGADVLLAVIESCADW
jgi:hypothetical protein